MDIVGQGGYGCCEMPHVLLRLTQQMQGQAERAAGADSRKGTYGFYSLLKGL